MASLKEIRTRIKSVTSTRQVTSAMKMVSAAKLRKAQEAVTQIKPYVNKLHEIFTHISGNLDTSTENVYIEERKVVNKVLIVCISSNKGLCGAFNSNIVKSTMNLITTKYSTQYGRGNVKICAIGKKAAEALTHRGYQISETHHELFDNLQFSRVKPLAEAIMSSFANKEYDKVEIIYNQFKNAAVQILTTEQYLPIKGKKEDDAKNFVSNYIYEPSQKSIVLELIPQSLKIELYKILLDSFAAEQGARMTAMHMATENAIELLRELKLNYNKARQAAITTEILEIVSGSEALAQSK